MAPENGRSGPERTLLSLWGVVLSSPDLERPSWPRNRQRAKTEFFRDDYVDDAWSVFMVVNRAEDASGLDGHHTHSKLTSCHAIDLKAKVNRCK